MTSGAGVETLTSDSKERKRGSSRDQHMYTQAHGLAAEKTAAP